MPSVSISNELPEQGAARRSGSRTRRSAAACDECGDGDMGETSARSKMLGISEARRHGGTGKSIPEPRRARLAIRQAIRRALWCW